MVGGSGHGGAQVCDQQDIWNPDFAKDGDMILHRSFIFSDPHF